MELFRRGVTLVMAIGLAGGVWTHLKAQHDLPRIVEPEQFRRALDRAGLRVSGEFRDVATDATGFEIARPDCDQPFGLLPVAATFSEIPPDVFRFRDGEYDIGYVYNGQIYAPQMVSYRLSLLNLYYRALSNFGLLQGQFDFYYKLWRPAVCTPMSDGELASLARLKGIE